MTIEERNENIAIIGMAGRFPGADNVDELWNILCDGKETLYCFKDDELSCMVSDDQKNNKNYIKRRGVLKDIDKFDAGFFKISPREAEIMDPQQRLILEVAWEALENSGYSPQKYDGVIGVFAGSGENTYLQNHVLNNEKISSLVGYHQRSLLNSPDYLALRVAYKFNLTGPSVSLYTGCSTSLVSICMGVDSLINFQSDIVLAGGSFVWCPQNTGYMYHPGGILSGDGHCRPFDANAKGTVFSNGAGIVVLKRMGEAVDDNDNIMAVIRGCAVNNDGANKVSFSAPSVQGQTDVIAMAQAMAGVEPEEISFIEAHGTGTPMGDPIEIAALKNIFTENGKKNENNCVIGSIKSNIGHLDAAAGVASLIKTVLALKNKKIPATLHFKKENKEIDFKKNGFKVNDTLEEWDSAGKKRIAGISSFGVGGTNAHLVLEEAKIAKKKDSDNDWQLMLMSAKTEKALNKSTDNLYRFLKNNNDINIEDVSYTLSVGRNDFQYRQMVTCSSLKEATANIVSCESEYRSVVDDTKIKKELVFMFPGQGAQYVNMGAGLYLKERLFRDIIDYCAAYIEKTVGYDFRRFIYPDFENIKKMEIKIGETQYTQPVLFSIEYAMAKMIMEWGVEPAAMIGHSIGEYVAACLAGVFNLDDALSLIVERGRLIQGQPKGAMLTTFMDENNIKKYLSEKTTIAAINAPSMTVVSGEEKEIYELEETLKKENVYTRRLKVSHAFHSKMMESVKESFRTKIESVERNEPKIPFISNITGKYIKKDEAKSTEYWCDHIVSPVRFSEGLRCLLKKKDCVFLEVGPGNTLNILSRQNMEQRDEQTIVSLGIHPKESKCDNQKKVETLGKLWLNGISPDWTKYYKDKKCGRIPLPTYPFERERYWLDEAKREKKKQEIIQISYSEKNNKKNVKNNDTSISLIKRDTKKQKNTQEIESELVKIWCEVLGVKKVGIEENFFELGGSSLLAVSLLTKIEKINHSKLPISTLYKAQTIKDMAKLISNGNSEKSWRSLVRIKTNGDNIPLFLIHGAGGNVLIYRQLAERLCENQPVYGLQSKGLCGKDEGHECIEDMASHYIEEIFEISPNGPFILGGYCMGGTVAFEMAQQLSEMGKKVQNLLLFETYNYSKMQQLSKNKMLNYYFEKAYFHYRNFKLLDSREKIKFFNEKASVARARKQVWAGLLTTKFGMHVNNNESKELYKLWRKNDLAADRYKPRKYHGNMVHFIPMKEYRHHSNKEIMWDDIVKGKLKKKVLPVYPAGMLIEPFVKKLATEVDECIRSC